MAMKKVRVRNSTADTGIRARIVHFLEQVQFTLDVAQGAQQTQPNVATGDRGVTIYEDFNEKIIATGQFPLDPNGPNIAVVVSGDQTNGYNLAFEAFT
jgi:hypothetical protein